MSKTKRTPKQQAERPADTTPAAQSNRPSSTTPFVWIGIVLLAVAIIARLRLLNIPFERDEGVFTYIGQALSKGGQLYTDLYDNKLPGLYLIFALFSQIFGALPFGIHLGTLLWQVATLAVFFLWMRQIMGRDLALASTGLFALYAASGAVLGFAAHATQLCALPAIAGLWALWRGTIQAQKPQVLWILLGGLGAGFAIWIKQQAFFYALGGGLFLVWWWYTQRRSISTSKAIVFSFLYGLGVVLPLGLSVLWFASQGRFDDFWFWTVQISSDAAFNDQGPGGAFFFNFYFPKVIANWWFVWLIALYGVVVLFKQKKENQQQLLAWMFPLSFWGISVGGAFYPHYFVLILPWLAIYAIFGLNNLVRNYGTAGWIAAALTLGWPIVAQNGYWFRENYRSILMRAYDNNPFDDMVTIGAELKKRSTPADSIAIIGSEPELFLYADRPSALSHLFFQSVVQKNARYAQFQKQTREQLWGRKPRFVVLPGAQYEFLKDDPLVKETVARLQKEYHTICVVDILDNKSQITWDPPPERNVPQSLYWIMVLERN